MNDSTVFGRDLEPGTIFRFDTKPQITRFSPDTGSWTQMLVALEHDENGTPFRRLMVDRMPWSHGTWWRDLPVRIVGKLTGDDVLHATVWKDSFATQKTMIELGMEVFHDGDKVGVVVQHSVGDDPDVQVRFTKNFTIYKTGSLKTFSSRAVDHFEYRKPTKKTKMKPGVVFQCNTLEHNRGCMLVCQRVDGDGWIKYRLLESTKPSGYGVPKSKTKDIVVLGELNHPDDTALNSTKIPPGTSFYVHGEPIPGLKNRVWVMSPHDGENKATCTDGGTINPESDWEIEIIKPNTIPAGTRFRFRSWPERWDYTGNKSIDTVWTVTKNNNFTGEGQAFSQHSPSGCWLFKNGVLPTDDIEIVQSGYQPGEKGSASGKPEQQVKLIGRLPEGQRDALSWNKSWSIKSARRPNRVIAFLKKIW